MEEPSPCLMEKILHKPVESEIEVRVRNPLVRLRRINEEYYDEVTAYIHDGVGWIENPEFNECGFEEIEIIYRAGPITQIFRAIRTLTDENSS